jgi:hypothetical protein
MVFSRSLPFPLLFGPCHGFDRWDQETKSLLAVVDRRVGGRCYKVLEYEFRLSLLAVRTSESDYSLREGHSLRGATNRFPSRARWLWGFDPPSYSTRILDRRCPLPQMRGPFPFFDHSDYGTLHFWSPLCTNSGRSNPGIASQPCFPAYDPHTLHARAKSCDVLWPPKKCPGPLASTT